VKGVFYWDAGKNGGLIKNISSTAQAEISPKEEYALHKGEIS